MKFSVNASVFGKELDLCQRISERKATIPILSNVLLTATGNGVVTLSATDLDISLRTQCDVTDAEPGATSIPSRKLYEIVKSLIGDVRLEVGEKTASVSAASYRGKLQTLDPADFPVIAPLSGAPVALPRAVLRDLIIRVDYAVSSDDTRYFLHGAKMLIEPTSLTLIATDGHRLSKASVALPDIGPREMIDLILPARALGELRALLDDEAGESVTFARGENHAFFVIGHRTVSTRLIDGKFPDYARIIPPISGSRLEVSRACLSEAVRRSLLTASSTQPSVQFDLASDGVRVKSSAADVGEAAEQVGGEYTGPPVTVRLNGRYVLDVLDTAGTERIEWCVKDEAMQVRMAPVGGNVDHVAVVMPMRI